MKKIKPYKFLVPLYEVMVEVVVGRENIPKGYPVDDESYACVYSEPGLSVLAVFNESKIDHNTIAHESLHIAWRVLERVGATVHVDNQEPLAYVIGAVAENVYKAFERASKHEQEIRAQSEAEA